MGWSCRRPGCSRPAVVCITYDAVARQVWLDPIAGSHPSGQPLCDDHALRLNAPRGWVVVDRRTDPPSAPAVVEQPAPPVAAPAPAGGLRFPRRWGQIEQATPRFRSLETPATVDEPPLETPLETPFDSSFEPSFGAVAGGYVEGHTVRPDDPPTVDADTAERSDGELADDDTMPKRKKKADDRSRDDSSKKSSERGSKSAKGKGKSKSRKRRDEQKPKSKSHAGRDPERRSADDPAPTVATAVDAPLDVPLDGSEVLVVVPAAAAEVASGDREPATDEPAASASAERLLKPKGRLLSKAFEAGGEQRSAITVRGDDPSR